MRRPLGRSTKGVVVLRASHGERKRESRFRDRQRRAPLAALESRTQTGIVLGVQFRQHPEVVTRPHAGLLVIAHHATALQHPDAALQWVAGEDVVEASIGLEVGPGVVVAIAPGDAVTPMRFLWLLLKK